MADEIILEGQTGHKMVEEDKNLFGALEEKISHLLMKYQELMKEKEKLAAEVDVEKEKRVRLEKQMELLSQDREKVKGRIDQLLYRLRSIDL
jgi:chromosome segregation ATPase